MSSRGTVETRGRADIEIRARVRGFLEAIHFIEGTAVEKGELYYNYETRGFPSEEGPGASAFIRDDAGNDFCIGAELFWIVEDSFNDDIGGHGRTLPAWAQPFLLCEAI